MTVKYSKAADLEPIEIASGDESQALQLERMKATLRHAYANVKHDRRSFDAAGVHPGDLRQLSDLSREAQSLVSRERCNEIVGKLQQQVKTNVGISVKVLLVEPMMLERSAGKACRVIDHRRSSAPKPQQNLAGSRTQ
jgi:phenylacetate-coenzyme A ligase PaaK-like adenylate-forming protein